MAVKYLVSGGEGALGKTVISMLLQRGEKVRILMSELSDTRIYRNNPNIEICYGISTDKDSMREFFELDDPRSAVLFHTDEYVSLSDSTNLTMRRVNVIGAENVVDMCLKRKVGKLVYLSSAYALNPEVSGEEITIHFDRNKVEGEYAKSKAEAAAYVMEKVALNRLNAVMVLPTFIIGPGYSQDYEINKVLNSYLNNGTIPPKEGGRAFVDVRDVANAMLTLADKGEPGAGYIISGDYKTSGEFFQDVNDIKGIDAPVKTASKLVMSKSLAKLVDFYYKITHKENPKQAYTLFSENPDARFEDNAKDILPESTVSFKDSLNDTIKGAQQGGIQAAAAVDTNKSERKSSADAMEVRLKQQQNVTAKAHTASTAPAEAPSKPAHTRPATAAAQAAAAAKAAAEEDEKKEEETNKSIVPQSTLKDPDEHKNDEDEPKLNSETTFRFGTATATTFTRVQPQQAKSIIPPKDPPKADAPAKETAAPKSEPVKSIIPQEPAKTSEAPKPAAPSSGFPRAAATPSSGFPRAAATPSSGFPRAAATPSSTAAPKPAAPASEAPNPAAPSSGFPRAAATPSSGFPRAAATPSSTAASKPAAPASAAPATPAAPAAPAAPKEAPAQPINSAFKSAQSETPSPFKTPQADSASPFKTPAAESSSPFKTPAAESSSPFKTSQPEEPKPFKPAQSENVDPLKKEDPGSLFAVDKSDNRLNDSDIEAEIEAFTNPSGPAVPPGIFAPPKG